MRRSVYACICCLAALAAPGYAQHASVGASYTVLSLTYPDQIPNGFGGFLTWDFVDSGATLGLDVGTALFPEDHPVIGRQTQFVAGPRVGVRARRFGAFARLRPGVIHFSRQFFAPDTVCILIFPTPDSCLQRETNFALDIGGTVELHPTARSLVRLDAGNTTIRFARPDRAPAWKHNFQFAGGAGFRF